MQQTNFFYLLIALLFVLIAKPLADQLDVTNVPAVRALIFSGLLVIGIWSLRGGGRLFALGMAFVVTGVILNVLAASISSATLLHSSTIALVAFLLVAIIHTLKQVAIGTGINANRLVGAVCVYLLLGVIWAMVYSLLETASPGSFAGFSPAEDRGWSSDWLYFSFVTMTTLGYGDLLPVSPAARTLAYFQAVTGQFYIAVLVAGLVGAYISQRQNETSG